ncbi:MAG: ATP-binding protein [Desulforhopalus sp.]|jgi:signal transduction histidine kinase/CheY-like chemotaxis protein/HPt (histidine-containing phosphotransfer) domain-containing protein|nr:ATP-binding protein [Desulforhopalus sp.]
MTNPAQTPSAERIQELERECAYLRRKVDRLKEQRQRQEKIDDVNRHFLKQTNEKLRRFHEQARLENLAKSDFLANMSHEIRTPLNIIIGMANLLADTPLNQIQSQYLHSLRITGRQLLEILNNILEFSRIEAGRVEIEPEPFSLHEVITQIETSALPLCLQKSLSFSVHFDPLLVMERVGDQVKIFQILLNLVNNAVKFTPKGTVTLHIHEDYQRPDHLILSVIDSGIGIALDKQKVIFDRFTQAHDSLAQHFGGTGLGLAISKKLSEAMGGELSVRSAPGRGATFSCRLPLPTAPPKERYLLRKDRSDIEPNEFPSLRLLVVDDIAESINVIRAYLKGYPVEIEGAENGQEALDWLTRSSFNIILMDVRMPVMDGVTATREIRRREEKSRNEPAQNILAITAHAFQEQKAHFLEAGFNGVLTKPFFKRELIQALLKCHGDKHPGKRPLRDLGNKAFGHCFEQQMITEIPENLQPLLPEILINISKSLHLIQELFNHGDYLALSEQTHALKGLAGMYGFHQLATLLSEFTDSVLTGKTPVAVSLLKSLECYLDRLKQITP